MSELLHYGTSLELTQPDQQLIEEMSATICKQDRSYFVKNTTYPNGKLLVRTGKESKLVDIYALVIGTFPVFKFSGWASYKDIIQKKLIINLGMGNSYCLPQNSLRKSLKIIV